MADSRQAWLEEWPNHCQNCNGTGVQRCYDGGAWEEACSCIDDLTCPRCGVYDAIDESGSGPCSQCRWDYDDSLWDHLEPDEY